MRKEVAFRIEALPSTPLRLRVLVLRGLFSEAHSAAMMQHCNFTNADVKQRLVVQENTKIGSLRYLLKMILQMNFERGPAYQCVSANGRLTLRKFTCARRKKRKQSQCNAQHLRPSPLQSHARTKGKSVKQRLTLASSKPFITSISIPPSFDDVRVRLSIYNSRALRRFMLAPYCSFFLLSSSPKIFSSRPAVEHDLDICTYYHLHS